MIYDRPLKKSRLSEINTSSCDYYIPVQSSLPYSYNPSETKSYNSRHNRVIDITPIRQSRRSTWSRISETPKCINSDEKSENALVDDIKLFSDDESSSELEFSIDATTPICLTSRIISSDPFLQTTETDQAESSINANSNQSDPVNVLNTKVSELTTPRKSLNIFNDDEQLELFPPDTPSKCVYSVDSRSSKLSSSLNRISTFERLKLEIHADLKNGTETTNCAICLSENPDNIGYLPSCFHSFCFECIYQWSQITNLCPLCKVRFFELQKWEFETHSGIKKHFEIIKVESKDLKQLDEDGNDPLEHYVCRVCNSGQNEHVLLICDDCDASYHTYCVNLDEVPSGSWYCPECQDLRDSHGSNQRNTYQGLHHLWNSVATESESELQTPRRRNLCRTSRSVRRPALRNVRQASTRQTYNTRRQRLIRRENTESRRIRRRLTQSNASSPNNPPTNVVRTRRHTRVPRQNITSSEETSILTRSRARQQTSLSFASLSSDVSTPSHDHDTQNDTDLSDESSDHSTFSFFKYQRSDPPRRSSQRHSHDKQSDSFESRVRRRQMSRNN